MGKNDLVQLAVGFVVVALMVLIAILFPVYGVYENLLADGMTYVRRPIWDPPDLYHLPQGESPQDDNSRGRAPDGEIESDRPALPEVTPPNVKAGPIFMDPMRGSIFQRKNLFGTLTAYLVIAYLVFAGWKWGWRG